MSVLRKLLAEYEDEFRVALLQFYAVCDYDLALCRIEGFTLEKVIL